MDKISQLKSMVGKYLGETLAGMSGDFLWMLSANANYPDVNFAVKMISVLSFACIVMVVCQQSKEQLFNALLSKEIGMK